MWNYNHWTGTTGRRSHSTEPPENRFLLYFWVLREHFWALMKLNLFVLLTSLPIVTIAPSVSAMNRVIFNMIERKPQLLWEEYWDVFRKECKTAILTGIPIAAVVIFLFLLGGFFRDVMVPAWASLAALCGTAVVFVISNYVFAMLPYVEISILQCYKNAAILLLLCFWHNAINILIILFVTAIFVMGHPLTTPILLFFAVPIFGYFIAFRTHGVIKKFICVD